MNNEYALSMWDIFAALLVVGLGVIGVYDFAITGVESPLVWALDGNWAPSLWLAIVVCVVWPQIRRLASDPSKE